MSHLPEAADLYFDDPLGFALDCFEPGSLDLDAWQRRTLLSGFPITGLPLDRNLLLRRKHHFDKPLGYVRFKSFTVWFSFGRSGTTHVGNHAAGVFALRIFRRLSVVPGIGKRPQASEPGSCRVES